MANLPRDSRQRISAKPAPSLNSTSALPQLDRNARFPLHGTLQERLQCQIEKSFRSFHRNQEGKTMLSNESIAQFRTQLRGALIAPDDARYADARKVYNGMIDRKPALIAECADVADVQQAISFGRDNGVRVSIRGGGHNAGGLGGCADGLVF